tara:strand:- start:145 stop:309 length:165 start_codon:yes stop_codon:yes gene_type:complete
MDFLKTPVNVEAGYPSRIYTVDFCNLCLETGLILDPKERVRFAGIGERWFMHSD